MYISTLATIVALIIYAAVLGVIGYLIYLVIRALRKYIGSFGHSENISALRKSAKRRRQSGNPCRKFCGRIGSDAK